MSWYARVCSLVLRWTNANFYVRLGVFAGDGGFSSPLLTARLRNRTVIGVNVEDCGLNTFATKCFQSAAVRPFLTCACQAKIPWAASFSFSAC